MCILVFDYWLLVCCQWPLLATSTTSRWAKGAVVLAKVLFAEGFQWFNLWLERFGDRETGPPTITVTSTINLQYLHWTTSNARLSHLDTPQALEICNTKQWMHRIVKWGGRGLGCLVSIQCPISEAAINRSQCKHQSTAQLPITMQCN